MKIFKSNIRKLSLSIALIGTAMVGQTAWACEKPNVSGYQQIGCLSEGLAYVITQDEKVGYVDGAGQLVIPATYKELGVGGYIRDRMNFSEGLAVVKKIDKNEVVFIDKTGKVVLDDGYYTATNFKSGLAEFKRSSYGGWNIIDKTGKVILNNSHSSIDEIKMYGPIAYISAYDMGWSLEKRYANYYYAINTGKFYKYSGSFKENRIYVSDFNDKYGFLDETGKEVIPLIYQSASDFSDGLAYAKKDGKWGYIDTNGKTIIDFKYDNTWDFENGKAKVKSNDDKTPKYFYIDKTGKVLTTRTSLADFRKKLEQGDDVYYQTADGSGKGMIFEIKGNLVQVQTKESQCSQRDYKGNCQNYIENQVGKWVKKSEVYPTNHFD